MIHKPAQKGRHRDAAAEVLDRQRVVSVKFSKFDPDSR
jgi:hypothetical protein